MTTTLVSGTTSTGLAISGAGNALVVLAGGSAVSTTVQGDGLIVVSSGGTASASTVSSGGVQIAFASGAAFATIVSNFGSDVVIGGSAFATQVASGGHQFVLAGLASGTQVGSIGVQSVSGGIVSSTTIALFGEQLVSGGSVFGVVDDGQQVVVGGTVSGVLVSGIQEITGGSVSATEIANGGTEEIYGGTVSSTTVDSGGLQDVAYGSAISTTVLQGGSQVVVFSGADGTVLEGGHQTVSGGTVTDTTVSSGGLQTVLGGEVSATVISGGGSAVLSGGTLSASLVSGGFLTVSGGTAIATTVSSGGNIGVSGGVTTGTVLDGGTEAVIGAGVASGTVVGADSQDFVLSNGTAIGVVVSGLQIVAHGGTASGSIVHGQQSVTTGGVAAGVTIDAGGGVYVLDGGTVTGDVLFTAATGGLNIFDPTHIAATISGFSFGDLIEFTSVAYAGNAFGTLNGDLLTVTEGAFTDTLTIDPTGLTADYFHLASDGFGDTLLTLSVTCFCAGTHIATLLGETQVEALRVGDLVVLAGGGVAPVRWVGVQTVSLRFADPARVLPVRIAAGALGDRVPCRDLLLSPAHALLLGGVLVQAGALVGLPGIEREHRMPERFRYYHVELDTHALLLAEGVAAESYLPVVEAVAFDNLADRPEREPVAELPYARVKAARQLPEGLRARLAA